MSEHDLVLPIVHLNGTSRGELLQQRVDAGHAVKMALDALAEMAPHGRDYYLEEGLLAKAQAVHARRVEMLRQLYHDLSREVEALAGSWR